MFGFVDVLLTNYTTGHFITTSWSGYLPTLKFSLSLFSKVKMPWSHRDSARNKCCS